VAAAVAPAAVAPAAVPAVVVVVVSASSKWLKRSWNTLLTASNPMVFTFDVPTMISGPAMVAGSVEDEDDEDESRRSQIEPLLGNEKKGRKEQEKGKEKEEMNKKRKERKGKKE